MEFLNFYVKFFGYAYKFIDLGLKWKGKNLILSLILSWIEICY